MSTPIICLACKGRLPVGQTVCRRCDEARRGIQAARELLPSLGLDDGGVEELVRLQAVLQGLRTPRRRSHR